MNNKSMMRIGKKIKIMLFVFMMVMMAAPRPLHISAADIIASGNCTASDSIKWKLDADGVLTISGNGYPGDWDGHKNVFYKKSVKSVVIEEGITYIGTGMFKDCTSLTDVTIPNSVKSIGSSSYSDSDGVFEGCTSLKNITIPPSVTEIDSNAFKGCISLTDISIPENVTEIGDYAFKGCTSLKNITIPPSVTYIGSYAFYECNSLTDIIIPDAVTIVREGTFKSCISLTDVTIPNSVKTIGSDYYYTYSDSDGVFEGCTSLKNITIPPSVTKISSNAFKGCTSLTDIAIPTSITSLSMGILSGCTSLVNVTIPESVTSIDDYTFKDCTSLKNVTIPASVTSIDPNTFEGCTSLTDISIPESVTDIGNYAFEGCTSLKNITIPNSVTSIGSKAFEGCISLTDISIPESVTYIGSYAFKDCTSLINVSGLMITNYGEFHGCRALKNIVIPDGATEVWWTAFTGCPSLASIKIPKSVREITDQYGEGEVGNPASTVLIVEKPSYAYDWVTGYSSHRYLFKVVGQPITITFDSAGGNSIPALSDVAGNSEIKLPNPQRKGYEFVGWYDGNGNHIEKFEKGTSGDWFFPYSYLTESITLYAHWRRNAFTVTFDTDGGSSIPTMTNIAEKTSIKKPKDPTKKGYVFAGWFKGSEKYDFSSGIYKDITLKAKWTKNKAKIEKCSFVDIGYTYKLQLTSNAPIKKVKWSTSNKKILKVTKKKKNSVTVEGLKNKKKATLKAVVTFQDGTKQTVKQTIRVKKKVKHKKASKSKWKRIRYPKGIRVFDKETPAINRGRDEDGVYEYLSVYGWKNNVLNYGDYLKRKRYKGKTSYFDGPNRVVLVYIKGNIRCRIYVHPLSDIDAIVNIEWDKKIKK